MCVCVCVCMLLVITRDGLCFACNNFVSDFNDNGYYLICSTEVCKYESLWSVLLLYMCSYEAYLLLHFQRLECETVKKIFICCFSKIRKFPNHFIPTQWPLSTPFVNSHVVLLGLHILRVLIFWWPYQLSGSSSWFLYNK